MLSEIRIKRNIIRNPHQNTNNTLIFILNFSLKDGFAFVKQKMCGGGSDRYNQI